jgi:hypothetical protein
VNKLLNIKVLETHVYYLDNWNLKILATVYVDKTKLDEEDVSVIISWPY